MSRNRRGAFLEILRGSNPRPPRAKRDKDGITLFLCLVVPCRVCGLIVGCQLKTTINFYGK